MKATTNLDSDTEIVTGLESDLQAVTYVAVSFLALLIYDWIISLDREVIYVWFSKWGLVKILYLINRYSPFVDVVIAVQERLDPNPLTCGSTMTFNTIFSGFGIGISTLILMLRTYWMYNKSRRILALFGLSWIIIGCVCTWAVIRYAHSLQTGQELPILDSEKTSRFSCLLRSESLIGLVCYFSLLAGETVIILLTVWKAFDAYRHQGYRYADLVDVVYREGILFYLFIYPISVANVVVLFTSPVGPVASSLNLPLRVIHSLLCCRLVIHVRDVTQKIATANSESPELLPIVIDISRYSTKKDSNMCSSSM